MANSSSSKFPAPKKALYVPIAWEGENDAPQPIPLPPAMDIAISAGSNALLGGINGMIKEVTISYPEYKSGKIDQKQFTYRVMTKGGQTAAKSGGKTVVALSLKEGVKAMAQKIGSEGFKRFAKSGSMTMIAFGIVDQSADTYKFYKGEITETQYKINTSENIGGTGGAIGGAAVGAMLGSVIPGLGTSVGFILGGVMGMLGQSSGASFGKSLGESIFLEGGTEDDTPSEPPVE